MSKIELQIENLREALDGLKKVKAEAETIHQGVINVHKEMSTCWEGPACDEYLRRLLNQSNSMDEVKKMIDTYIKYGERALADLIEEDRRQKAILQHIKEMIDNMTRIWNEVMNDHVGSSISSVISDWQVKPIKISGISTGAIPTGMNVFL